MACMHGKMDGCAACDRIGELERKLAQRDNDWVLAIADALGMREGYSVPIVPQPEPFRLLFSQVRAKQREADARDIDTVRVPRNATEAMVQAAYNGWSDRSYVIDQLPEAYRRMIDVAIREAK